MAKDTDSLQAMRLESIDVSSFTCFKSVQIDFSGGINIIIGENGSGKTHLLKLMFAVVKFLERHGKSDNNFSENEVKLANQLKGVFKPDKLGRLVSARKGMQESSVKTRYTEINREQGGSREAKEGWFEFAFSSRASKSVNIDFESWMPRVLDPVFIPSMEMLSRYEGFAAAYEQRESAFDETYYLLTKQLGLQTLKGEPLKEAQTIVNPLEEALGIKVELKDGRFRIRQQHIGSTEAALVGEGIRKIGQIIHLILNGAIKRGSVLFWDEPETNLNPRLIPPLCDFLVALARAGVQLFVATHDYLLSQRLSTLAEYPQAAPENPAPMRFFSLSLDKEGFAAVESGNTLLEIDQNSILEEHSKLYDFEHLQARLHRQNRKRQQQQERA